jgi:gamma-glutamyl:cysteine ligase YbdK (ATP-grasp superfamily)
MEDYTYLWHDARPHPNLGTVEVRAMDSQTHIEHSRGPAAWPRRSTTDRRRGPAPAR